MVSNTTLARWDGPDLLLACYLQPRGGQDAFIGEHDGMLKIRISAPPVDGAANAQLITFLAKSFGVAKSAVAFESGETSRKKRLRIRSPKQIPDSLGAFISLPG